MSKQFISKQKVKILIFAMFVTLFSFSCHKHHDFTDNDYILNDPLISFSTKNLMTNYMGRGKGFEMNEVILLHDSASFNKNVNNQSLDYKKLELNFDNYSYLFFNTSVRQRNRRVIEKVTCSLIDKNDHYELKFFVDTKYTGLKECINIFNFLKCKKLENKPVELNIVFDYEIRKK